MRLQISILAITITISGCASSGVVPADKDTFLLSKVSGGCGFGSPEVLKTDLYREAGTFCQEKRQRLDSGEFTLTPGTPFVRCASATLQFKCAAP